MYSTMVYIIIIIGNCPGLSEYNNAGNRGLGGRKSGVGGLNV